MDSSKNKMRPQEEEKCAKEDQKRTLDNIKRGLKIAEKIHRKTAKEMGMFDPEAHKRIRDQRKIALKTIGRVLEDRHELVRKSVEEMNKLKQKNEKGRAQEEQKNHHKNKPKTK